MGQTVTLIGSSGLVGSQLLKVLLADEATTSIILPVRKDPGIRDPKVRVMVMDFTDDAMYAEAVRGSECVFCAVGTTNKKVKGDKTAYRKVDFDIPVKSARAAAEGPPATARAACRTSTGEKACSATSPPMPSAT